MQNSLVFMMILFFSNTTLCAITPEITNPDNFNENIYIVKNLSANRGYSPSLGSDCGDITLKDFTPKIYRSQKNKTNNPLYQGITSQYCSIEKEAKGNGYVAGMLLPERIYFDNKDKIWKKKTKKMNTHDIIASQKLYGVKNINELKTINIYNIESVNASGYAIIDYNITKEEKRSNLKKKLSFCLFSNAEAFCGSGSMIYLFDGKEVDFTNYVLKSLETVEITPLLNWIIIATSEKGNRKWKALE